MLFLVREVFLGTQGSFLLLELTVGTIIAAEIGQAVVKLELEVK